MTKRTVVLMASEAATGNVGGFSDEVIEAMSDFADAIVLASGGSISKDELGAIGSAFII